MSPLKKETLTKAFLPTGKEGLYRLRMVTQGDEEHPGTWEHERNVWDPGGTFRVRTREDRIIDFAADPETCQVVEKGPRSLHPYDKELRGIWLKVHKPGGVIFPAPGQEENGA